MATDILARHCGIVPRDPVEPDGGFTWSVSSDFPYRAPDGDIMRSYGDIVAGPEGNFFVAVYSGDAQRDWDSFVFRSTDDGRNWEAWAPIGADARLDETALFHVGDGHWIAAARESGLHLYASNDNAKSWHYRARLTPEGQHPGHFTRLKDGTILLSYGNRTGGKGIDVRFSQDEGKTWSVPYRVADFRGDGGYPSSVQLPDGRVLTTYYASWLEGRDRYHMGVALWDPETTRR